MSTPQVAHAGRSMLAVAVADTLAEKTRTVADQFYQAISSQYLNFRKTYYRDEYPSLTTPPPAHNEVYQTPIAQLAEQGLRLLPQAIKSIPFLGDMLVHLEDVADINSFSEEERQDLHSLTMTVLAGVQGGIQPWFVNWYLLSAHNLATAASTRYFLLYPWEALLYRGPEELAAFDKAVGDGNVDVIVNEVRGLATRLVSALGDPVRIQPKLTFTGPHSSTRQATFNIETTFALLLGGLIAVGTFRSLTGPKAHATAQSVLAQVPPEITAKQPGHVNG